MCAVYCWNLEFLLKKIHLLEATIKRSTLLLPLFDGFILELASCSTLCDKYNLCNRDGNILDIDGKQHGSK